jgi:hypothetical protein
MVDILVEPDQRTDQVSIGDSPRARAWTLAVACMGVALVVASMTALNTALGDLAVATSATQSQLNWIVDGYTVALACLLLPAGALGDRYGRRGALLLGLLVFALGSAAPAVLHDPVQIIAGRAIAGIGAAFVMPATLSLLGLARDLLVTEHRGAGHLRPGLHRRSFTRPHRSPTRFAWCSADWCGRRHRGGRDSGSTQPRME